MMYLLLSIGTFLLGFIVGCSLESQESIKSSKEKIEDSALIEY
jgi:hypothetical protein